MKQLPDKQLKDHIQLVKWEQVRARPHFNLMTVHSLLIDDNSKFIELKGLVQQFNETSLEKIDRLNLRKTFIARLYKMLCQLTRMQNLQNQANFLQKIYQWANNNNTDNFDQFQQHKLRPSTASTRTRPFSAYSRPFSASRGTAGPAIKLIEQKKQQQYIAQLNKQFQNVDYQKLQLGQMQFYQGIRTLHPELQHPKKRLKQYHRKVFYQDLEDSDEQIIQEEQPLQGIPLVNVEKFQQKENQIEQPEEGEDGQKQQGQQNADLGQDINVDDIPLDIGQEQQQQTEKIDKLKPKVKAYHDFRDSHQRHKKNYAGGTNKQQAERNYYDRKVLQDQEVGQYMAQWGKNKQQAKKQVKRRAQSARMVTKQIGISKRPKQQIQNKMQHLNVIDFGGIKPKQTKNVVSRPRTAFVPHTEKLKNQFIQNAFISGKLSTHITLKNQQLTNQRPASFSAYAPSMKKKTFEQILFEAENKVVHDAEQQVINIKETLAKNKVNIAIQKITKSISCQQPQLPGQMFIGQITGGGMMKNPFIKIAKKKKKKKKK